MSKDKLLELFGDKYAIETAEGTLDYIYNLEDKSLLSMDRVDKKHKENSYMFSTFFSADETIDTLYLFDLRQYEILD